MKDAIVLIVLIPFGGAVLTAFATGKVQTRLGVAIAATTCGAVAALVAGVLDRGALRYALGGWPAPLGIVLQADGLSLLMLGLTAVVAMFVSVYSVPYFGHGPLRTPEPQGVVAGAPFFWPLWLLLWGGLNATFVSADLFNLYLLLEFTLLPAVALAAMGGTTAGHISALRYLLAATVAALFYLVGVTLLYAETATLDLQAISDAPPETMLTVVAVLLMAGALALKCALFPLHFWLPGAHSTAPAPVSAVLSGLVVKAAFYVFVRLWVQALPSVPPHTAARAVAALGAAAILWGSWQALRQSRLKMLVAYSTVAQVGYLFLLIPMAVVAQAEVVRAAAYHMVSHGLSKAALFLAAGALIKTAHSDLLADTRGRAREAPLAVAAIVVAGAALAGLLPGGGAKGPMLALAMDHGEWWTVIVIVAGMALAAAYTIAAVRPAFSGRSDASPAGRPSRLLQGTALALALAAAAFSLVSKTVLGVLDQVP